MTLIKHKTSYGLALCRYGKNGCVEILSIKKRFTYCYFSFIHGFYNNKNTRNDSRNMAYIKYLFNNMSYQEKLLILSMNYSNMWWYIWLNNPEKGIGIFDTLHCKSIYKYNIGVSMNLCDYKTFFKKKNKFEKKFLNDGGKRLHDMINDSKNCDSIWEIPKGAKNANETDLDAAIREFTEETLVQPHNYNVLYHVAPITISYKDNGVIYKHIYYLAELNEHGRNNTELMNPKLNFKSYSQLSEVADIRWLNTKYIRIIDMDKKIKKNTLKLYDNIAKCFKKQVTK